MPAAPSCPKSAVVLNMHRRALRHGAEGADFGLASAVLAEALVNADFGAGLERQGHGRTIVLELHRRADVGALGIMIAVAVGHGANGRDELQKRC